MKKKSVVVCFFLVLSFMFTFFGCTHKNVDTSPEYNPETDYNIWYEQFGYGTRFIETEDGFYYLTREKFLRFIDKNTMKEIALCNKPNCSHWRGDENKCNSYMGAMAPEELYYYKGKLYGFTDRSSADELGFSGICLSEISKDGSSIKKIWELQWKGGSSGYFQSGALHRGIYYFYTNTENSISIYAYDMETKKCKCIYDDPDRMGTQLKAIGDYLYWRFPKSSCPDDYSVMRYEISTGKIDEFDGFTAMIAGGERVYFRRFDEEKGSLISYTGRDGKNIVNTDISLEGVLSSGDDFFFGMVSEGEKANTILVYDSETMELVDELDISSLLQITHLDYVLSGNDELFFVTNIERTHIFYAYKSTIGTPDFQWHQVEKVN